ncbi:MAG: Ran-binding zinc finger domain-containing protein [Candidatus Babeliales bacterium]
MAYWVRVKKVEHQEFSFQSYVSEQAELGRTVGYPEFDTYMDTYIRGKRGSVLMRYNHIKDPQLRSQLKANDELRSKEIILWSWNRNSQEIGETSERACKIRATLCRIIDSNHFSNALNQWTDITTEPDVRKLCDLQKEVAALQKKSSPEVITLETSRPPLAQPISQEQGWECPACTFFNEPNAVVCETCGKAK